MGNYNVVLIAASFYLLFSFLLNNEPECRKHGSWHCRSTSKSVWLLILRRHVFNFEPSIRRRQCICGKASSPCLIQVWDSKSAFVKSKYGCHPELIYTNINTKNYYCLHTFLEILDEINGFKYYSFSFKWHAGNKVIYFTVFFIKVKKGYTIWIMCIGPIIYGRYITATYNNVFLQKKSST